MVRPLHKLKDLLINENLLPHSVPKGTKSGRASLKTRKGRASLKTRKGRTSFKTRKGLVQGLWSENLKFFREIYRRHRYVLLIKLKNTELKS
jgi:hypothetical protein